MQKSFYILSLLFITNQLSAQTATGSWFGKADVDMAGIHNNYLTELVIKQKGNRVEGIFGYYFKDKYQSFFVHGHFNPGTREVTIENIPVIYFNSNSTVNSVECNTEFRGKLMNSRAKSTLVGHFYRDEKYKYTCPDLLVTYTLDRGDQKQDSIINVAKAGQRIWKPQSDDVVVDVAKTAKSAGRQAAPAPGAPAATTASVPVTSNRLPAADPIRPVSEKTSVSTIDDSSQHSNLVNAVTPAVTDSIQSPMSSMPAAPNLTKADIELITASFTKRKPVLNTILDVESDSVRVSFYDNGEIDGDSISVFVNNKVVLTHQELAAKALTIYLHLDSTREVNELSMFAENLGKYPPNTALMVVTDGTHRYEVFMSSSLTENATIQLRRKKPR
jgi:hypothetical protein